MSDDVKEPRALFNGDNGALLQKVSGPKQDSIWQRALALKDTMHDDAVLESVSPIEADREVVAHRVRYIRAKDDLEIRTNGYEHHVEVIMNGTQLISRSEYWPEITLLYQSNMRTDFLMTVQETVLELFNELASIARNSMAIVAVQPCYGSSKNGRNRSGPLLYGYSGHNLGGRCYVWRFGGVAIAFSAIVLKKHSATFFKIATCSKPCSM